jgi:hypothetical protein
MIGWKVGHSCTYIDVFIAELESFFVCFDKNCSIEADSEETDLTL